MLVAALRLRGRVGVRKDIEKTLFMLGLKKKHSLVLLESTKETMGMIKKSEDFIAWGELSKEVEERLKEKGGRKTYDLAPPKGRLKSLKARWPKGDLGYRGDKINELIKRMM